MTRSLLPLLVLGIISCRGGGGPTGAPAADPSLDLDMEWQSTKGRLLMRLTDTTSTSTEVRRALGSIFNGDPNDPTKNGVDPMQLLMRGAEKDEAGAWVVPEAASDAELLAGTGLQQALAFKSRVLDADGTFSAEEAVDACGNPVYMSLVTPEALAAVVPDAPGLEVWPESCGSPEGCEPETGTWDVAIGERRADGMIDMVVNILPVFDTDPTTPGVWGNLTALFFTEENPGQLMIPLFANMDRLQINMINVWQHHQDYANPTGSHELYQFPHRERTLDLADIFVYPDPYADAEDYWEVHGTGETIPFGLEEGGSAVGVDTSAALGRELLQVTNRSAQLSQALTDIVNYTLSASLACPGVQEDAWIKEGPVEFFVCADGDVDVCVARQDRHEGACQFLAEPTYDLFDFTSPQVTFPRVDAQAGTGTVAAANLPTLLEGSAPAQITITVDEESVLYVKSAAILTSPVEATLPEPETNPHCEDSGLLRYDLGTAWTPGTYTLTVDLTAGELPDDTGVGEEEPGQPTTWFYYTDTDAWMPN